MTLLRSAGLVGVAAVVLGSLTIGAAMPASAATTSGPLFPNAANAADYALTVRGQDLFQANSDAAKAAWTPELGRVAASNANIYRAATVYGNLDPLKVAEVIPVNGPVDELVHGKLAPGVAVTNGIRSWVGTGFSFPRFGQSAISALRSPVGSTIVVTAALLAFEQRAQIASGVTSWVGINAEGAVCSDPVAGGHNPINWITGQNCDQWRAAQDFTPNFGTIPKLAGWVGNQFWWGGVHVSPYLHAVAGDMSAGSPQAGTFTYSIDYALPNYTTGDQPPVWSAICKSIAPGSNNYLTVSTFGDSMKGPAGTQRTFTFDCGSGYAMYALGRVGSWGSYTVAGSVDSSNSGQPYKMNSPADDFAYLSPLSPDYTAAVSGNPDRQIQCTQYGASGAVTNGYTASVTEVQIKSGGAPQPNCTALPNGEDPNRVVLTEVGGGESNVYYDKSQTSAATDWDTKYKAACGTGVAQKSCLLDLVQVSNGISCFSATANCADWFSDPARDSKYQCQYANKNEAVNQCYVYANVFDAAKRAAGNPYADPLTGKDPGAGTGTTLDQLTMGNPAGSVIGADGSVASCWGGGSYGAFNPVGWIVRGGQCLLNWAFVPRPAVVQAQMEQLSTGWDATGVGKLATAVKGWRISPVVSGCSSNLPFPVPMIHKTISVPIIQACPGTPMGDFAPWIRGLVSASLAIGAAFAVKRIVSGWLPQ